MSGENFIVMELQQKLLKKNDGGNLSRLECLLWVQETEWCFRMSSVCSLSSRGPELMSSLSVANSLVSPKNTASLFHTALL